MKIVRLLPKILPFVPLLLVLLACQNGGGTFAAEAKQEQYSINLSTDGLSSLKSSDLIKAGASISVNAKLLNGISTADSIKVKFIAADGSVLVENDYFTSQDKATAAKASVPATAADGSALKNPINYFTISSIDANLDKLELPASLDPGIYTLSTSFFNGSLQIQKSDIYLFSMVDGFGLDSLAVYPSAQKTKRAVLVVASYRSGTTDGNSAAAWITWSSNGKVLKEGLLNEDNANFVWTTPADAGSHVVSCDLYPSKPPASTRLIVSPAHQDVKIEVAQEDGTIADEFADDSKLYSHFAMADALSDSGSRAVAVSPSTQGKPGIAVYPNGFGYRFTATDVLRAPGAVPQELSLNFLTRFYTQGGDGNLFQVVKASGESVLRVYLANSKPVAELANGGKKFSSAANFVLPKGLSELALNLVRDGDKYHVFWYINGEVIYSPDLPVLSFSNTAVLQLGDLGSLDVIFDEFAIHAGDMNVFSAVSRGFYQSQLVFAEGFENDNQALRELISGDVDQAKGLLSFKPDSQVVISKIFPLTSPLSIRAGFVNAPVGASIEIWDAETINYTGEPLLTIASDGRVSSGGNFVATLSPVGQSIAIKLVPDGDRLKIFQSNDQLVATIKTGTVNSFKLGLRSTSTPLDLDYLLIHK